LSIIVFFSLNLSIHNINTRNKHHLRSPNANLSCFKKSAFYASNKIFNNLPPSLTILKNNKGKFKAAWRKYLNAHSFYTVDEFCVCKIIYNTVLYNVSSILHWKNCVFLCIYGLFNILLSLWQTFGSMQCAYVCVCVCVSPRQGQLYTYHHSTWTGNSYLKDTNHVRVNTVANVSIMFWIWIQGKLINKRTKDQPKNKFATVGTVNRTFNGPCNENQPDALFILSLFRQPTSTCFRHICSPLSGGILYIYNNWYLLCLVVDCLLAGFRLNCYTYTWKM